MDLGWILLDSGWILLDSVGFCWIQVGFCWIQVGFSWIWVGFCWICPPGMLSMVMESKFPSPAQADELTGILERHILPFVPWPIQNSKFHRERAETDDADKGVACSVNYNRGRSPRLNNHPCNPAYNPEPGTMRYRPPIASSMSCEPL